MIGMSRAGRIRAEKQDGGVDSTRAVVVDLGERIDVSPGFFLLARGCYEVQSTRG
jgi:hypothetical protein